VTTTVGAGVGASVGHTVGTDVPDEGTNVGARVGLKEYSPEMKLSMGTVGTCVGGRVGTAVGITVGAPVGTSVWKIVGAGVGTVVGSGGGVGVKEGMGVGMEVGRKDGAPVGGGVGGYSWFTPPPHTQQACSALMPLYSSSKLPHAITWERGGEEASLEPRRVGMATQFKSDSRVAMI
jgi:hypothetical protein